MPLLKIFAALAIIIVAVAGSIVAQAHKQILGDLTVVHSWSRATAPAQKAGGVFLQIQNAGSQPDRLIAIESDRADVASLHATIRDGDVVKMRPIEGGIEVPAHGVAVLAPGGKHVMLIGLREQLVEDTTFPLTLIFERAGRFEIIAIVESAGARGPTGAPTPAADTDHNHHDMKEQPAK